jgi:predicted  nucleic acid-binding Zn-ribbon protein
VFGALEGFARTGVDSMTGQSGLLDCIVLALMTNRDRVIHDLQADLQGRKSSIFKLKKEMSDLRHELDAKTKMLSIYEKRMQEYEKRMQECKPNIPGKLLSLCKKLVKASREV